VPLRTVIVRSSISPVTVLRGTQAVFGLRMTGILDRATAEEIENIRSYYSVAVQEREAEEVPAQPEA